MKIIHQIKELRHALSAHMKKNETIGLVPTMGALHRGHVSLIEESIRLADITVVTIFVNPTQFGPHEDFAAYPRTLDEDAKICEVAEVDYIFAPSAEEMYHNPSPMCLLIRCTMHYAAHQDLDIFEEYAQ